jgi:aminoglycoside 3-N-acetyltransferase
MYKSRKIMYARLKIPKDRIVRDLRKIGIKEGDHICAHSSLKSIGFVKGGPDTVIDALLEVVGPNGTIMMPSFTPIFWLKKLKSSKSDYIFDYRSTPTWIGLVPEILRKRQNSIRSRHPTNSVVAIGKYAKYLTDGHDENSRAFAPFSRLAKINGKILGIGAEHNCLSIGHEAQSLAGLLDVVPIRAGVKFRDDDGNVKLFIRKDVAGCDFPDLIYIFREMGLVTDGRIGLAKSILLPAKELLEVLIQILNDNPYLNLCNRVSCLWCREFERRLNIYDGIKNPKSFQRYILIRRIISIINWFRLRESRFMAPLRLLNRFVDAIRKNLN